MSGVQIKGDKSLMRLLKELPRQAKTANRRAVNLGTTPLLRAVKSGVPIDHGDLRRSQIKKITSHGTSADGIVGADANYVGEDGEMPSHYDFLVEGGHVTPDGIHVAPQPYMATAYDSSIAEARATYEAALAEGIEKAAEMLGQS